MLFTIYFINGNKDYIETTQIFETTKWEFLKLLTNEFYNFASSELLHMDSDLRALKVKVIALEKNISSL
jgi:hypothetical protein